MCGRIGKAEDLNSIIVVKKSKLHSFDNFNIYFFLQ